MKHFALAEVKAAPADDGAGTFEAVISAPTLDRDGEVIDPGAFKPLPKSIPIHAYHSFGNPVGRGSPAYDGDTLKVTGYFASTEAAQEIRRLVAEGVIGHMSVGFMPAPGKSWDSMREEDDDGTVHIVKAELLEASFVSVPSNRDAAVTLIKQHATAACPNCTSAQPSMDAQQGVWRARLAADRAAALLLDL